MTLDQPSLLDWQPRARTSDPITSHMAAERAALGASKGRLDVLRALIEHGPQTDFEIAEILHRQQTSAGKRRGELRDHGYVMAQLQDSGAFVTRPAPSGSQAIVWDVTNSGRAFYAEHSCLENSPVHDERLEAAV